MSTTPSRSSRKINVLIVDDSLIVRERLVAILDELAGIEIVGQAGNVAEAVNAVRKLQLDVMILDIRLPDGNALDILRNIKQATAVPTIIILTNYPYPRYRQECLKAGADFFLDKSIEFDQIPTLLEQLKQAKNPVTDDLAATGNIAESRRKFMQLKIGDSVVHPIYGIGHIDKVEEREFFEQKPSLYYQVTLSENNIWIPVEAQKAIGLRLVTAKHDLDQYRDLLKSRPVPLNVNAHQRHLELTRRLKQGSFQVVCEIVRDLTAAGWRVPLTPRDTTTLQKTRKNLHQEWAMAAGVSVAEAIKEVDSLLLASQQTPNVVT